MAIRKMRFISIIGKLKNFDRIVYKYITDSNLHPENAMNVVTMVGKLTPFSNEEKKNDQLLNKCSALLSRMDIKSTIDTSQPDTTDSLSNIHAIETELAQISTQYEILSAEHAGILEEIKECTSIQTSIENIMGVDFNLEEFFNLDFYKFRFGKISKESYKLLQNQVEDLNLIILPLTADEHYHWMICFYPTFDQEKIDGVLSAMQFERTWLSSRIHGTPENALAMTKDGIADLKEKLSKLESTMAAYQSECNAKLLNIHMSLKRLARIEEVRRNAVHTKTSFYVCGWIPEEDLGALTTAIDQNESDTFIEDEPFELIKSISPPTDLKNNRIFKYFEVFVKIYGLPSYNEIDPTPFLAITYFLMFGIMFGDVGQGLIIVIAGLVLMRKKFALAGIFSCVGLSSMIFGFVYGSVFGNEELIHGLIHPMEGQYILLGTGVGVGVVVMTIAMILNMINGLKEKNLARILFDRNGIAGFLFYWIVFGTIISYLLTGKMLLPVPVLVLFAAIPFVVIFFKEPLERLMEKKSLFPGGKGMFFTQGFFEMVDMLLSMASNTISFVRIGAFALNHAGLFMAFHILGSMAGETGSIFVNIFANLLIIILEGMIVGIQCLRLEYYEIFSRFFKGEGKVYKPLRRSIIS